MTTTFYVLDHSVYDNWDDADIFSSKEEDYADVLLEYLEDSEANSCFVDGYPNGFWRYSVKNDSDEIRTFQVGTDWSPEFYITECEDINQTIELDI